MNKIKLSHLCAILVFGVFFVSCSSNSDDLSAKEATKRFVSSDKSITGFGHFSLQQILNKADYLNIPKISTLLKTELPAWKKGIDLNEPLYFAISTKYTTQNLPDISFYGFIQLNEPDSLLKKFASMGYSFQKSDKLQFFQEGDVATGIKGKLLAFITKPGDWDAKKTLSELFNTIETGEVNEQLTSKWNTDQDLSFVYSMERTYSENQLLKKLPQSTKIELEKLVKDGIITGNLNFENGALRISSKGYYNAFFTSKFKSIKKQNKAIQRLGSGYAWAGMASNVDVLVYEKYFKDFIALQPYDLSAVIPKKIKMALALLGENPISNAWSGQFAAVAKNKATIDFSNVDFSASLLLGNQGNVIKNLIDTEVNAKKLSKIGNVVKLDNISLSYTDKYLDFYSISAPNEGAPKTPDYAQDFGKNLFDFYIDVNYIVKQNEALIGPELTGLKLIDFVKAKANINETEFVIQLKNKNVNFLKQVVDAYVKQGVTDLFL